MKPIAFFIVPFGVGWLISDEVWRTTSGFVTFRQAGRGKFKTRYCWRKFPTLEAALENIVKTPT